MQSLEHQALAFFRSKPRDERYRYTSCTGCAYAQFLRRRGVIAAVSPVNWLGLWLFVVPCFGRVPRIVDEAAISWPHTFGALADRLEKALSK